MENFIDYIKLYLGYFICILKIKNFNFEHGFSHDDNSNNLHKNKKY